VVDTRRVLMEGEAALPAVGEVRVGDRPSLPFFVTAGAGDEVEAISAFLTPPGAVRREPADLPLVRPRAAALVAPADRARDGVDRGGRSAVEASHIARLGAVFDVACILTVFGIGFNDLTPEGALHYAWECTGTLHAPAPAD